MKFLLYLSIAITIVLSSCDSDDQVRDNDSNDTVVNNDDVIIMPNGDMANIVSVVSSGMEQNYTFSVGISSLDTGCTQYADWWEVITEDETLIYRRVLAHSHVNEQPFVRSGGTVNITANQVVIIRAHMNNFGYGTTSYKGSVSEGFTEFELQDNFAESLANIAPLPNGCAF